MKDILGLFGLWVLMIIATLLLGKDPISIIVGIPFLCICLWVIHRNDKKRKVG